MAVREKETTPLYVPAAFTNGDGKRARRAGRGPRGRREQVPPPRGRRERTWRFWVGMTAALVLVVGWVAAGAFFVGQGTRPSEGQVADRIADRVASERFAAGKERRRALDRQEAAINKRWKQHVKRISKRAYGDGRSNGFSAGRSAGYAAGAAAGRAEAAKRARKKERRQVRDQAYAASCLESDGFPFSC